MWYSYYMMNEKNLTVGSEALLDGFVWVVVEAIEGGFFFVVDQDGGEHEVSASRLDPLS